MGEANGVAKEFVQQWIQQEEKIRDELKQRIKKSQKTDSITDMFNAVSSQSDDAASAKDMKRFGFLTPDDPLFRCAGSVSYFEETAPDGATVAEISLSGSDPVAGIACILAWLRNQEVDSISILYEFVAP